MTKSKHESGSEETSSSLHCSEDKAEGGGGEAEFSGGAVKEGSFVATN